MLKKFSLLAACLALLSISAFAQDPPSFSRPLAAAAAPHSTNLSWIVSTAGAVYNVYRAPCTGFVQGTGTGSVLGVGTCTTPGTFALITPTPVSGTTYSDTAVTPNAAAVYQITSVCPTGGGCPSTTTTPSESVPSNQIAALTPGNQPLPPILSIPSLTMNINGDNTQTVTASWSDYPLVTDRFSFSDGKSFLQEGVVVSQSGSFAERWTGPQGQIWVEVCNVWGTCRTASNI